MISYSIYKVTHLVALFVVTSCFGVSFFSGKPQKWARIVGMTASFLILLGGMGLLARLGMKTWPNWVLVKIGIWCVIAIGGPLCAKRLTNNRGLAYSGFMLLFGFAVYLAVYKPF